ncbi:MAG TPA: protein kinase [Kofleriaceae bacterium]|nr:protein kinase [Kofleriaceae bacterium]
MIGQVIGNYRIVSELGRGGMGMVYRAEHVQLGRPAALKMLLPALSSDPGIVQRFFNEARAASAIDHPGIVEVYDFGTHTDGSAYIVMPLLKGESLESRLRNGQVAPLEGASWVVQVLSALSAAHARGIVHRDLKPDNIFLVANELMPGGIQVKLLDFGIAKLADDKAAGVKTQTGMMIGTPAYMSPEQCMGRSDLDHRTDIYSIGCILFHVVCGRPPFLSEHGTGMIIAAQMRDAPPDPRSLNPNIPPALAAVILKCLEKDPAARYQTANDVKNALIGAGAQGTVSRAPVTSQDSYAATLAPSQSPSKPPSHASMSYDATVAPGPTTTRSGSAAQMVAATQPPAKSSRGAYFAVGGVLLALAGIGVGVAMSRGDDDKSDKAPPVAAPEAAKPAGTNPTTAKAEPVIPEAEKPAEKKPADTKPAELPACDEGMTRTIDTGDHCCWTGQAWSNTKNKCIGAPTCPPSMRAKGEACIAAPTPTPTVPGSTAPASTAPAQIATAGHPTFKLDAKTYAPGDPITIKFASALSSKPNNRAWVTWIDAGKPQTAYATWEYVADGATTAQLAAPKQPGSYEMRLHTNYPTQSYNVVHTVPFTVDEAAASTKPATTKYRFHVNKKTATAGESIELTFGQPMIAAKGERFWVTIVKPGAADDSYGKYEYVPDNAHKMMFEMPGEPGDYELRLHANYPTKSTNVVHRVKIHVDG